MDQYANHPLYRRHTLDSAINSLWEFYKKNFAALEFHHSDPETKLFQLDLRSLSNRKWDAVLMEVDKCRLLCSNCHTELHNPDCKL